MKPRKAVCLQAAGAASDSTAFASAPGMDGRAPAEGLLRSFTMSNNPRWCKPNPARERSPGFRRHRSARAAAATCRQRPAIITPWEVAAWSGRSNPQHQALGSLGPAPSVQPAAGARHIAGLVFHDPLGAAVPPPRWRRAAPSCRPRPSRSARWGIATPGRATREDRPPATAGRPFSQPCAAGAAALPASRGCRRGGENPPLHCPYRSFALSPAAGNP